MKNFTLVLALVFLFGLGAQAGSLKSYSIGGTCTSTSKTEQVACPLDDETSPPQNFTYYQFPVKESKTVKTMAASCSEALVAEILKLNTETVKDPHAVSGGEDVKVSKPLRFLPEACTLLTLSSGGAQLALFEQREFEKDNGGKAPEILHRQILFVTVQKGHARKIIENMLSVDTMNEDKKILNVHSICDTDKDGQAEIVLNNEVYFSTSFEVIKIKSDASAVAKESFMASGGCGG